MRRILALALCLLLIPAALAERYVVDYYGIEDYQSYSMLLRDDGTPLTPERDYASIYRITPKEIPEAERLYLVTPVDMGIEYDPDTLEDVLYSTDYFRAALMDAEGKLLTGFDYDSLEYINGAVVFSLPGDQRLTGAMDVKGNVIIEPVYAALKPLSEGRWLAMAMPEGGAAYYDDATYALQLIDADGSVRDLDLHTQDRYFNVSADGIATLWDIVEFEEKSAFIDSDGNVMFDRTFESAESFSGGYAVVRTDTGYGVIDKSGEFVVEPVWNYVSHEDGKCYIASNDTGFAVFDEETCAPLMAMDFEGVESVGATQMTPELLYVYAGDDRWIYTMQGECLRKIESDKYIETYDVPAGAVDRLVEETGEWPENGSHLVDLAGNVITGDYRVLRNGCWQDGEGRYVSTEYSLYMDSEGEYSVNWNTYRYGLIDQDGNTLLEPVYDEITALDFDRYWVTLGDRRGMIDGHGKWYYSISDYSALMD